MDEKSYSTPSERWAGSARRFFKLQRIDGLRLARTIWWFALVVYAVYLTGAIAQVPGQILAFQNISPGHMGFLFFGLVFTQLLQPLLWLLLIRLVLEVCLRLLGDERAEARRGE